ncbi:85/88 kDa calcium-independent phospholipase A2-like isoform X2 [Portunus trituberculatus]|uniref:85/88 kDa calcium-independent phospholipase A2-like isoform X2 n=1 Tax=Portunus trituberculatus TaxID=210409 RepID=UPI001E1D0FDD|nr:85/88 kDa calcium-independent phospholipase A2-like isoform X2 [Portunus trituberculatus]
MDTLEDAVDARTELLSDDAVICEDSLHVKMSQFFGKLARGLGWGPQPTKVNSVNWNDYANRAFTFVEGPFIIAPLAEDDIKEDPNLAFELIIHKEINSSRNAYSLLRTCTETEAKKAYEAYRRILVPLVDSCGKEVLCHNVLQKILDFHREHTSWHVAHITTHFGFLEALKNEEVLSYLNVAEAEEGLYPLHVAVENESEKIIAALMAAGATLDITDAKGNTPLHVAATKSVAVIQALKVKFHAVLNRKNHDQETPLLLAAQCSKLENIKHLIQIGANINHREEMVDPSTNPSYWEKVEKLCQSKDVSSKDLHKGGSLLHWVKTRELCDLCLDIGCDPNLLNSLHQTPLHVLVLRNRMQCIVTLLCRGAKANCADQEGITPLHMAAGLCSTTLVQAFIVFGGEINAENKRGETPRHLAAACKVEDKVKASERDRVIYLLHTVGAKRCAVKLAACSDGCVEEGNFNGVPLYEKPLLRSRWVMDEQLYRRQTSESIRWQLANRNHLQRTGRVLCLDGGGIKGLVMTQMLFVMEEVLGRPIQECFDWISGTSTGGFLALMLCMGKSVQDVQSLYYNLKEKVFVGGRPYEAGPLEEILIKEFGEDTVMSTIKSPRVMVTSTLADRLPPDLHLFRNYESPMSVLGMQEDNVFMHTHPPDKQKIWLAARCSGAAPTYFSASEKFLDGGLVGNNPILDTLTEIEEWNMAVRSKGRESEVFTPTVVVSLGCGKPPVMLVDTVDVTIPSLLDVRRGLQAMYNLFNVLVEQACSSEGRVTDRARAWCSTLHVPFFRFNPQLSQDIALDEHDDECLMRMMWETRAYMKSQAKVLAQLKSLLVESDTIHHPTPLRVRRRSSHTAHSSSADAPDTPHKLLSEGNSPEEEVSFHSTLLDCNVESSEHVLLEEEASPSHPPTPEPLISPDYVSSSEAPCSSPEEACEGSEKTPSSESPLDPATSNMA